MRTMTRVKMCGFTRPNDIKIAVALGVDAFGFNFFPKSPRYVDVETAAKLVGEVPSFLSAVGLFVNPIAEDIEGILKKVRLNLLQFHGDEDNAFCAQFDRPFIKVLKIQVEESAALPHIQQRLREQASSFPDAQGFLFDTAVKGQSGGTGKVFNWQAIPEELRPSSVLAGGLHSHNVTDAIEQISPWAVDVSSGIESAAGLKDIEKMSAFMQAVKRN